MKNERRYKIEVENMSCYACEERIESKLKELESVYFVRANYKTSEVEFVLSNETNIIEEVLEHLQQIHYPIRKQMKVDHKLKNWIVSIVVIVAIVGLYQALKKSGIFYAIPMVQKQTPLSMLFVIGLFSSVHCISMCGGIALTQSVVNKRARAIDTIKPTVWYNTGRIISYTILGGIVGVIGSLITPSGNFRGLVAILASGLMLLMGITMLGLFSSFKKWVPKIPTRFRQRVNAKKQGRGPFYVGLLNGFMPCGPLQMMQLYALSTGSFFLGALSMFLFSAGTIPLMLGLGVLSTFLNVRFTNIMMRVSAVLMILLGFNLLNSGLVLSGLHPIF